MHRLHWLYVVDLGTRGCRSTNAKSRYCGFTVKEIRDNIYMKQFRTLEVSLELFATGFKDRPRQDQSSASSRLQGCLLQGSVSLYSCINALTALSAALIVVHVNSGHWLDLQTDRLRQTGLCLSHLSTGSPFSRRWRCHDAPCPPFDIPKCD